MFVEVESYSTTLTQSLGETESQWVVPEINPSIGHSNSSLSDMFFFLLLSLSETMYVTVYVDIVPNTGICPENKAVVPIVGISNNKLKKLTVI